MSYSCFVSFKKMSEAEIIPFLRQYKKTTTLRLKEIAEENFGYCPHLRSVLQAPEKLSDVSDNKVRELKDWARSTVFQYKYFYDEINRLLCVFGVPTCMRDLFDATIYFQNSCDQDYPREEWNGVEAFLQIYDKWANASEATVREQYKKRFDCELLDDYKNESAEVIRKQYEYARRSFAYDEIWGHISDSLYDDDTAIYFSLYGAYDVLEIVSFVKYCHEAHVKWQEKYDC